MDLSNKKECCTSLITKELVAELTVRIVAITSIASNKAEPFTLAVFKFLFLPNILPFGYGCLKINDFRNRQISYSASGLHNNGNARLLIIGVTALLSLPNKRIRCRSDVKIQFFHR